MTARFMRDLYPGDHFYVIKIHFSLDDGSEVKKGSLETEFTGRMLSHIDKKPILAYDL